MIHMLSTIHVRPGKTPVLIDLLRERVLPILEGKAGWKLLGCFEQRVGRLNTLVDLWELKEYNHFTDAFAAYHEDPDYPAIRVALDECIEQESLTFMDKRL